LDWHFWVGVDVMVIAILRVMVEAEAEAEELVISVWLNAIGISE
jgi:cytochrome b561